MNSLHSTTIAPLLLVLCAGAVLALLLSRGVGRWFERRYRKGHVLRAAIAVVLVAAAGVTLAAPSPHAPDLLLVVSSLAIAAMIALTAIAASVLHRHRPVPASRRRVLAIGAHPDDLELACGATLAKLADEGHEIRTVVMSEGSSGGNASLRRVEAHRGSRFLGASTIDVHDLTDTRLAGHDRQMVEIIEKALGDFQPDLILTHSRNDYHQDHEAVHLATMRAARRHGSILCFESPSASGDFAPALFVDVSEHLDVKIGAVELHTDQGAKPYMSAEQLRAVAVFRGAQGRVRFAEGFEIVRLHDYSIGGL